MTTPYRPSRAFIRLACAAASFIIGCSAADSTGVTPAPVASSAVRSPMAAAAAGPRVDDALRLRLERAAAGLLYTSESDVPFTWFASAGPFAAPIDAATMRRVTGVEADAPVEIVTLDGFFARHIERVDPADSVTVALVPRYRRLRETLRRSIRDLQVFRVGRIRIQCYLVGTDRAGNIVGLYTEAIET